MNFGTNVSKACVIDRVCHRAMDPMVGTAGHHRWANLDLDRESIQICVSDINNNNEITTDACPAVRPGT